MTDDQEVRDLTEDECADVADQVELGERLCKFYLEEDLESIGPDILDQVFLQWKEDPSDEKPSEDEIAGGLGCLFGQLFVNLADGKWIMVSDSHGVEVAIELPNGMQSFPCSSIRKRIDPDNEELSFFEPLWHLLVEGGMDELDYLDDPET